MKKSVAIIGSGPAALLLAAFLDTDLFEVTVFEKNKAAGRKFLVAGKGGFNLTHSEPTESFLNRYTPSFFLENAIRAFDNQHLRQWLEQIGIPTFIGSSKRVFPVRGIKPIEVLNAILNVLKAKNVNLVFNENWKNWQADNALVFESGKIVHPDFTVFALGGGSWKVTGSDGSWLEVFAKKGIPTKPFLAANCRFEINWPKAFSSSCQGLPLKNIALYCGDHSRKGEAVITQTGLEGNAIYALSPQIQEQLKATGTATVFLDLKPTLSEASVTKRWLASKQKKTTEFLKKDLRLSKVQLKLLKTTLTKDEFVNPELLCAKIKKLPLVVHAAAPVDEAISTTGGVALEAVNPVFELYKLKNTFCIGEMLDWNAPTGGYLLQACFSMGVLLARHLNHLGKTVDVQP